MEFWVEQLKQKFAAAIDDCTVAQNEVTIEVGAEHLLDVARGLRDLDFLHFEQLIDLCGVDYSGYGQTEWETEHASSAGFSRAVDQTLMDNNDVWQKPRFAVVYHLLSVNNNQRIRVRCFVPEKTMMLDSVTSIWAGANWYEREAFDLFGIRFAGHDDLRRILTDYGFVGYPFRKDFPLIGHLEMRYDATEKRCVYEPVSIEPRTLVPRVIRDDSRYQLDEDES